MERQIYKVFATQVVISEQNPQGVLSDISNYPMAFDSRTYNATQDNPNGDAGIALHAARAEYQAEIVRLSTANNVNRVAWAVSIIRGSDGRQMDHESFGAFPDMTPPEPEPEEEPEEEQHEPQ